MTVPPLAAWRALRARVDAACLRAGRDASSVRLVAVSKAVTPALIAEILRAAPADLGESYLREAIDKQAALGALAATATWHHIGTVQSNKTAGIAKHFDWVHGVDRLAIGERLSRQRDEALPPLCVCVQVNVSGEARKAGCAPAQAAPLCAELARLPRLRLRGLMAIPAALERAEENRPAFARMALLYREIHRSGTVDPVDFDTLSMGMSGDFEVAIEEGATLVRVGQAIFGQRPAA
jgi:pyridoxal phosphate enzyme (YggS family)